METYFKLRGYKNAIYLLQHLIMNIMKNISYNKKFGTLLVISTRKQQTHNLSA